MAAGALAFSVMSAVAKVVGSSLPLFHMILGRSVVVAVLSGVSLHRQGQSFRGHDTSLLIQRALFGFAALSCYFYSVIVLPLADATVLYFTNPVLTAVAAAALLGERMGRREWVAVVLSMIGVLVIARPGFLFETGGSLPPAGVAAGLFAAVFGAGSYVTIRRIRNDPPLRIVFWFSAITCVLAAPMVLWTPARPTPLDLLLIVLIGVATHLGQLWITWGFRLERAGRASAVGYLQIVFAAGWGWLLFQEAPDRWTWTGAAVVVLGTLQLVRRRKKA